MNNVYLEHHGIKGQRWGVRRYQNSDGSLTSAGRKRYTNRQIQRDMKTTFNKTYKELHEKYKQTTPETAADRAYSQAKKINTKHLIDTYGKERMDQFYTAERKKFKAAGITLVSSMAAMSVTALLANKML